MIDSAVRSDESIKEKTAFALGTTPDKITISNKKAELDSVKFLATYKNKVYQCYYTTVMATSSDALCSSTDGSKSSTCDALSKAANQCH